jgi:hypothetical protein
MFLILVFLRKIVFLSLAFSACQGLKANLEMMESRIDILISDLDVLPFGHSRRV